MSGCGGNRPSGETAEARTNAAQLREEGVPAVGQPVGPLFRTLPDSVLSTIGRAGQTRPFAAGETLFRQGEPASKVLVILAGVVRIWRGSPAGASMTVRLMRAGDTPGFVAAYRRIPYPGTATGAEAGELMSWPIEIFAALLSSEPTMAANALAMVGERTEDMLTRLHEVATLGAEQRVARALLREAANARAAPETLGELALTRLALAQLSATTLHTVSRLVSDWRRAGIVMAERGRMAVLDAEALRRRARLPPSLR